MRRLLIWSGLLLAVLGTTDLGARLLLGLRTVRFTRPYDPFFVSGDFTPPLTRAKLAQSRDWGPAEFGYENAGGFFIYHPSLPVLMTDRSGFLFENRLSRYSERVVDRLSCAKPSGIRIFVIGDSLAVGSSATRPANTWHAVLERLLRQALGRQDVYIFNAAMGAFVSSQERLAFELAVRPRDPDFVIVMNGYNDLLLPLWYAQRPGDPFQVGLRYGQVYGSPARDALAEWSAVAAALEQRSITAAIEEARRGLTADDERLARYAADVSRVYRENMCAILDSCRAAGIGYLVLLQPFKAVIAPSRPAGDVVPNSTIRRLHRHLLRDLRKSPYAQAFVDLSSSLRAALAAENFTDTVHL